MKGIVIDINNKDAVILSDNGLFTKVKNENYSIGQTLQLGENSAARPKSIRAGWKTGSKLLTGAASMAAVLAIGTIGAFAYYTPTDYVSLDVNPSIEYSVNMFDRILDVSAVNDDGEKILENLDLNNKNIQTGVQETLDQLIADGYLADDPDDGVVIATSNEKLGKAEQLAAELEQEVRTYLDDRKDVAAKVNVEAVGPERVKEARELGVTPGKLNLVEKLQESTSGAIDREEWLTKPVKDLNKMIRENRKKDGGSYDPAWMTYNSDWNWGQNKKDDQDPNNSWDQNLNNGLGQNKKDDQDLNSVWSQNQKNGWNQNSSWNKNQKQNQEEKTKQKQNNGWNQNQNQKQNQKTPGGIGTWNNGRPDQERWNVRDNSWYNGWSRSGENDRDDDGGDDDNDSGSRGGSFDR